MRSSRPTRPGVKRATRATLVLALLVSVGGYIALRHSVPVLEPASCAAEGAGQPISLTVTQASIAATIAGVAKEQRMPRRAVTIAYATALQESKLTNLHSGDLDSVGVFQQRPSEGWGPARKIEDPVYATTRFFEALTKVPGYQRLPVYRAAQAVQHSADGYAYNQYAAVAAKMSRSFSGELPHAVWCWYPGPLGKSRIAAATAALGHAFGPVPGQPVGDPARAIRAPGPAWGWSVAAWLVSHAGTYGIRHVSYLGYEWRAGHGSGGWARATLASQPKAPPAMVVFG